MNRLTLYIFFGIARVFSSHINIEIPLQCASEISCIPHIRTNTGDDYPMSLSAQSRGEFAVQRFHANNHYIVADDLSDLTSSVVIETNHGFPRIELNIQTGQVLVENILRHYNSFMIRPNTGGPGYFLVIPSQDPNRYCQNRMLFARGNVGSYSWIPHYFTPNRDAPFEASVKINIIFANTRESILVEADANILRRVVFSLSSEYHVVPPRIYSAIIASAENLGMNRSLGRRIFTQCTIDRIEQLPSIVYTFNNRDSNEFILEVFPEDYFRIIGDEDECELLITYGTQFVIGANFLRNIAILFDSRNARIGLCDPVIPLDI